MFDLAKQYKTDESKELEGVWESLSSDPEGAAILVARVNNKNYRDRYRRVPRTIRQQLATGSLGDDHTDGIICRLLADTILLDWRDLADDGQPIQYSRDNAFKMLKQYPDFRELVWNVANDLGRFRVDDTRETVGN